MKKWVSAIIVLPLFLSSAYATSISLGIQYGIRTVSDADIKNIYGNGTVYFPFVSVNLWKGLTIGAGYEMGYSRSAKIGLFQEDSTLSVSGYEVLLGYELAGKTIAPYINVGYGSFSYKQTVNSAYAEQIDASKNTFLFSGGIRLYPVKGVFALLEVKYVPLKTSSNGNAVDLGGLRFCVGVGFQLNLN